MKNLAILMTALLLCGCGGEFPNEEMDIAGEDKLRPMAIVCDPPEAAPGDRVTVSLHFYSPDPSALEVDWRVALDYSLGLYETDETESDFFYPEALDPPTFDASGFGVQTWEFVVPEDVLLTTSTQPDVLEDELVLAVARQVLGKGEGEAVARSELDAYLRGAAPAPETAYLADLFGCEIRFRATLQQGLTVDVTRNLTVRYSTTVGSPNVNSNPTASVVTLFGVPHPDVDADDLQNHLDEATVVDLLGWTGPFPGRTIELHRDWTYILNAGLRLQNYTSPFDPVTLQEEKYSTHWYHVNLEDPTAMAPFFVTDEGDEAEMGDLDNTVRLAQPIGDGPHRFRVYLVSRDERIEWQGVYPTTQGVAISAVEFSFMDPEE